MDIIIYILSIIILFMTVYPFYYVFMLSFNEGIDASLGGIYWFPRKFTLSNYHPFTSMMSNGCQSPRGFCSQNSRRNESWRGFYHTGGIRLILQGSGGKKSLHDLRDLLHVFFWRYHSLYTLLRTLHLIDTFAVYVIPGMLESFLYHDRKNLL